MFARVFHYLTIPILPMASVFGHAIAAVTFGKLSGFKKPPAKFWILAILCSVLPDADVIMFKFGIPYMHPFGHRGFFHSIPFAFLLATFVTAIFFRETKFWSWRGMGLLLFFFICTASHGMFDAMTNGGRGIAFFSPFDNTRYFFPWRPIQVSPLGAGKFFSKWGWEVIKSELFWIGVPCGILLMLTYFKKKGLSDA